MKREVQTQTLVLERPAETTLPAPYRGSLLNQIAQRTEEAHPAWEGQFEEVDFQPYCGQCGRLGSGVCVAAVRCIRKRS